jgi:hypothetical protein
MQYKEKKMWNCVAQPTIWHMTTTLLLMNNYIINQQKPFSNDADWWTTTLHSKVMQEEPRVRHTLPVA